MNSSKHEEFTDENTGLSGQNQFLKIPPGGGKSSLTPQKSPLLKNSILKTSTRENLPTNSVPLPATEKCPGQVTLQSQSVGSSLTPSRYADIIELDQEENWRERASVVTKLDHEGHIQITRVILAELINNLPLPGAEPAKLECEGATPSPSYPTPTPDPIPNLDNASPADVPPFQTPLNSDVVTNVTASQPESTDPLLSDTATTVENPVNLQGPEENLALPQLVDLDINEYPTNINTTSEITEASRHQNEIASDLLGEVPVEVQANNLAEISVAAQVAPSLEASGAPSEPITDPAPMNHFDDLPLPASTGSAEEEADSLPVVPRGSYNIDWDNFDENSNPFETKTKANVSEDPVSNKNVAVEPQPASVEEPQPQDDTQNVVSEPLIAELEPSEVKQESSGVPDELDEHTDVSEEVTSCSTVQEQLDSSTPESEIATHLEAKINPSTESDLSTEQLPDFGTDDILVSEVGDTGLPEHKMSEPMPEPSFDTEDKPLPVPTGSYNIDWDNFDESMNPFETKIKVGGAPKTESPREAKTPSKKTTPAKNKTMTSDDNAFASSGDDLKQSPPASPLPSTQPSDTAQNVLDKNAENTSSSKTLDKEISEPTDINQNTEVVSSNDMTTLEKDEAEPREGGPHDLDQQCLQDVPCKPPSKKPPSATKKIPKRFKPPARFAQNAKTGADEVEIFAPPPPTGAEEEAGPQPMDHSSPQAALEQAAEGDEEDEFRPASAVFIDQSSWDMLEKFGSKNSEDFKESALARQSLYVKFDPLVKGRSPQNACAPFTDAITEQDDSLLLLGTPTKTPLPKRLAAGYLEDKVADDGMSEAQPSTMQADMDRLFSCSPQDAKEKREANRASPVEPAEDITQSANDTMDIVHMLKYSQSDLDRIKRELQLDFQAKFLAKERDWQKERDELHVSMQAENRAFEEETMTLRHQNQEMKKSVAEFELTMTQMISEKESSTTASELSLLDVVKERDTAVEDLHSVETAFSDLHRRFEKSKLAIEGFKKNEETYKKCLADLQQNTKKQDEKYQTLKKHAEEKLEKANAEIERIRKSTQSDITRLQAGMKRAELQIHGLEQQVEQKVKENTELTAICDELISKVDT